jgi:hypothetical protein
VSAHILSGRSDEQENDIPNAVLAPLKTLVLSGVFVSVEIVDIHHTSTLGFFIKHGLKD